MDAEARLAAFTIFFTLLAVKLATLVIVFILLPDSSVVTLFLMLNWFWFILPAFLASGAAVYWARLLRARRRRRELLRQEFSRGPSLHRSSRLVALLRRDRPNVDTRL